MAEMIIMTRKYSHVIVIGVDGAGAWFKDADAPGFDRDISHLADTAPGFLKKHHKSERI